MTRNLELARQTLESWTQKYPGDLVPHGFLAAFTSRGRVITQSGVEEGLKAIELDPNYSIGYENVAFAYIYFEPPGRKPRHCFVRQSEHKIETAITP